MCVIPIDVCNPHFREMLREQLLGDQELLADILEGREDPSKRRAVSERLNYIRALYAQAKACALPTATPEIIAYSANLD